jgi:hypothetical protein
MPLYNTATVATALDVPPKWLDNLLSHNKIDGVQSERQGVARRLSLSAVQLVAIVRELAATLDLPSSTAVRLAHQLLQEPSRKCTLSPSLSIVLNAGALDEQLGQRLAQAIEIAPRPVRGRPRRS